MTIYHFNTEKMRREVWCPNCKKIIITDVARPICEDCFGVSMITVLYSIITGIRLTGNEPLQFASSNPVEKK